MKSDDREDRSSLLPALQVDATDLPSDIDRQAFLMRGVGVVAAHALAGSEENARVHLVVTAPTVDRRVSCPAS
jgi:hypothetical protein